VAHFFDPKKVTAKTPPQPRKSPHLHHTKPPPKTQKSTKPPAKRPLRLLNIFFPQNHPNLGETYTYP
jgi:hypothetical protein